MIYYAKTSTIAKKSLNKIRVTERAMVRSILEKPLRDNVPNEDIRRHEDDKGG